MSRKLTTEEFIERSTKKHKNKYDYSLVEYKGKDKKVKIICPIHGEFEQNPSSHYGGRGCRRCGEKSCIRRKTTEKYKQEVEEKVGTHIQVLEEYKKSDVHIKHYCATHDIEFWIAPTTMVTGTRHGCRQCYLDTKSISHEQHVADVFAKWGDHIEVVGKYTKAAEKIAYRCHPAGHEFSSSRKNILNYDCRQCYDVRQSLSHEDYVHRVKELRGDKIQVLGTYTTSGVKILHRFTECGCEYEVLPSRIIDRRFNNSGCGMCWAARRLTSETYKEMLKEKTTDTIVVLEEYETRATPILHWCKGCDRKWKMAPVTIINDGGCSICSHRLRRKTHAQYEADILEKYAGQIKVLGTYELSTKPIEHQCVPCGNIWLREPYGVLHSGGCSKCSSGTFMEEMARDMVEECFLSFGLGEYKFPKVRPRWLRNPNTKACLELDCYNEELGLAFEYQGRQHYEPIDFFGGEKAFNRCRRRDIFKQIECTKNKTILILIDGRLFRHISKREVRREKMREQVRLSIATLKEHEIKWLKTRLNKRRNNVNVKETGWTQEQEEDKAGTQPSHHVGQSWPTWRQ